MIQKRQICEDQNEEYSGERKQSIKSLSLDQTPCCRSRRRESMAEAQQARGRVPKRFRMWTGLKSANIV